MRSTDERTSSGGRWPVIFAAHGAPVLLDDSKWIGELASWARAMPKPESILMVSAHWEARPTTIGATRTVPLVYDFYGFPNHYYETQYPAPGAPELAARVRDLLRRSDISVTDEPTRGLDHGAYYSTKDCLSFVIMDKLGITEALTIDSDFTRRFIARPGPS